MHFAGSTVAFYDPAWDRRLDEFAGAGCESVELRAALGPSAREGATFDYMDPYAVERAGRALERSGLALHSMHGPMMLPPPSRRSPFGAAGLAGLLEAERAACDAVMAMGGRFVVTQDMAELEPEDAPHLASREALAELGDYAHSRGCVFCVENGAEDAAAFERLVRAVRELAHPGLGICLDTGHAQIWSYSDVPRAIRECGTALRTCHLHDNLGSADAHLDCGDGIVPWRAVLGALAGIAYRGPLVMEVYAGRRGEAPGDAVRASREFLEAIDGDDWRPGTRAAGCDVFRASPADRERAEFVMGRRASPTLEGGGGDEPVAAIAVDRFGEAVAWGELTRDGDARSLAVDFREHEDADLARAMAAVIMDLAHTVPASPGLADTDAGALRAEGAVAEALAGLGYEHLGDGRFARPASAGKAPR